MAFLKMAAAAATLTLVAGGAHAGSLFSDNFNGENGGALSLNYTGFANFNTTGMVDLVATPDYGITCAGGSGSCVDLAGTPGPGAITSKNFYAFGAGDVVTLSFEVSGNQRVDETNNVFGELFFAANTSLANYTLGGGFGNQVALPGDFTSSFISSGTSTTGENQPFTVYTLSFTALEAGQVRFGIGTNDGGVYGPVLDNVSLTAGAVPEPASWGLMLIGFGGLGGALRAARRKAVSSVA